MRKKCSACGKLWYYGVKIWENEKGEEVCQHDDDIYFGATRSFTNYEKRIIDKLPPSKVMVKGSDKVARICDVLPKK